jgi:pimeloyl-ACP methyl ester carboxylesterase
MPRTRCGRFRTIGLVTVAILFGGSCTDSGRSFQPRFETVPCPDDVSFVILSEHTCGYLTVLEDRSETEGRTIRLFAVRVQPPSGNAPPDPMFHAGAELALTPGYSGIAPLAQRVHREVIMLDQRGTGHSEPSLACPEVRAIAEPLLGAGLLDQGGRSDLRSAAASCFERLKQEGVDPSTYTFEAAAADAEDLRTALGIDLWNIHVIGSASRIVFELMRRSPASIRSVVMDSPQFPQVDEVTAAPGDLRAALERLLATCAEDPKCDRAYPALATDLDEAVERLDAEPVTVHATAGATGGNLDQPVDIVVDGAAFVRALRVMVSDTDYQATGGIPQTIHAAHHGEVEQVAGFLAEDPAACVAYVYGCERYGFSEGTYYSFLCGDEVPFVDPSRLEATAGNNPGIVEAYGRSPLLDICDVWPVAETNAETNEPITLDVPTLIFYGDYDAYTSPSLIEEAGEGRSTTFSVRFPYNGHNLFALECPRSFRNAWVDEPTVPPDTSCIDDMPAPAFTLP